MTAKSTYKKDKKAKQEKLGKIRIPTPPTGGAIFKDKKKYTRKQKHKKSIESDV